jgi:histidinol-phosphate aminotransferase
MTAPDAPVRRELPLRAELRGVSPYGAPQLEVPVCLNVNENPFGPSPELVAEIGAAVVAAAPHLNRYPDREALRLRSALADYLGHELAPEQVWAANGSNEVMIQLLQAFGGPGRTMMVFPPTYSMYAEYARSTHTELVLGPRRKDFSLDPTEVSAAIRHAAPDLVVLASPNNPTGTSVPADVLDAVLAAAPGMVVVDEAYAEFARPGTPTALLRLPHHHRLVVTRTMSKAFALAGARVGYAAAHADVVDALRVVRLPYHLSAVTQVVAETALSHAGELLAQVDLLIEERDLLVGWLRRQGLTVADSDANFVFVGVFADRDQLWRELLAAGVLVRATGPVGWLRVSIGTPSENRAFRAALAAVPTSTAHQEVSG